MKFKSFIIACSIFSLAAKTTIYFPKHLSANLIQARKPDIEFAFDIHDVLVQKNNAEQKQIKHKYHKTVGKKKMSIVGDIFKRIFSFGLHKGEHYKLYKEISHLQKQKATGQAFAQVFTQYNDLQMANYVKERASAQDITPGMEKLVEQLSKYFTLRIASNIGDQFYIDLKKKHATFFNHFTGGTTVAYRYGKKPVTKPFSTYYQQHDKNYNPEKKKIILFVDDKKENVKAAAKHGWVGIHIYKKKNQAQQLHNALQQLKIMA